MLQDRKAEIQWERQRHTETDRDRQRHTETDRDRHKCIIKIKSSTCLIQSIKKYSNSRLCTQLVEVKKSKQWSLHFCRIMSLRLELNSAIFFGEHRTPTRNNNSNVNVQGGYIGCHNLSAKFELLPN